MRILAIPGSLRRGSQNRALLRAAQELAPASVEVRIYALDALPPYDGDVEAAGFPEPVRALHAEIRGADALLIATPEYNGSIPGVLKNAIDWASRPRSDSPLRHRTAAVMGAVPGRSAAAHALADLRRILEHTGVAVLEEPRVHLTGSAALFDEDLRLIDPDARRRVRELLEALVRRAGPEPAAGVAAELEAMGQLASAE